MTVLSQVVEHLKLVYPEKSEAESDQLAQALLNEMRLPLSTPHHVLHSNYWSEKDVWLITYGDSIQGEEAPLKELHKFVDEYASDTFTGIHVLPFFPYSSDDGFAVINYSQVNDSLGDWEDIQSLSRDYDLMADLVINHGSSRSIWFENFRQCKHPGKDYFFEADPSDDLSEVVRPRTSPLLAPVMTLEGEKHVWCTFGHDQVDFDFRNTDVLIEFVRIIRQYLDMGVRTFRMDAVAFLWKKVGTPSIHLPETHEIIRLLRTLVSHAREDAIVITETNVPNLENLSYFGNANEAHAVYNFSLPPLLLHALVFGTSEHLKRWQMTMPPAQKGTFYFNFIASHDGIGLRPAEGLLSTGDIDELVNTMTSYGARVSWRTGKDGKSSPYEINVTLFDALRGTREGEDAFHVQRFLCAHAIMFACEGLPAIYIHSFLGSLNYHEGVELLNRNRIINRYKWQRSELEEALEDDSMHYRSVMDGMKALLAIRKKQKAFHPNAVQYTLHVGDQIFGFWRQSIEREQSIFCLHNVTNETVSLPLSSLNLMDLAKWTDLLTGQAYSDLSGELTLEPYQCVWLANKVMS